MDKDTDRPAAEERGEGRPTGVGDASRPSDKGRPTTVRHAEPRTPPADEVPTEPAVDRGETPSTEHSPGGDL